MRIAGLIEKNSILKERNLELEGVLIRWRNEIASAGIDTKERLNDPFDGIEGFGDGHDDAFDSGEGGGGDGSGAAIRAPRRSSPSMGRAGSKGSSKHGSLTIQNLAREHQTLLYRTADLEKSLNDQIQDQTKRLLELEEENIEVRGRLDYAQERAEEMKNLVDVVMKEEQMLKSKATHQLTKIRLELENEVRTCIWTRKLTCLLLLFIKAHLSMHLYDTSTIFTMTTITSCMHYRHVWLLLARI